MHGVFLCCGDVCVVCLCKVCVSVYVSVSVGCLCMSDCVCSVWYGWRVWVCCVCVEGSKHALVVNTLALEE